MRMLVARNTHGHAYGGRRLRWQRAGAPDRGRLRRPSEQGRPCRLAGPAMVRPSEQGRPCRLAARQWVDEQGVATIFDVAGSSAALAVGEVAKQRNKILVVNASAVVRLTNEECAPYTVHYVFDTYALAKGRANNSEGGLRQLVFHYCRLCLRKGTREEHIGLRHQERRQGGGIGAGAPQHARLFFFPLTGAGLAGEGRRSRQRRRRHVNAIKQAGEFGLGKSGQRLAALLLYITDVNSLGLETAQGLLLTEAFYWDMNDETRAW